MALKMYEKKGPTWEQLCELRGIFLDGFENLVLAQGL
jgi:hypothetical protein